MADVLLAASQVRLSSFQFCGAGKFPIVELFSLSNTAVLALPDVPVQGQTRWGNKTSHPESRTIFLT